MHLRTSLSGVTINSPHKHKTMLTATESCHYFKQKDHLHMQDVSKNIRAELINGWASLSTSFPFSSMLGICARRKNRPKTIFNLQMIWAHTGEFLNKLTSESNSTTGDAHKIDITPRTVVFLLRVYAFPACSLCTYGNADKHTSSLLSVRTEFEVHIDSSRSLAFVCWFEVLCSMSITCKPHQEL